jgi:hypothetical protein
VVVALVGNVGLSVGAWDTWGGTKVLKSFSVLGSSKEEGVSTYYNIIIRIEVEKAQDITSGCKEHELIKSETLSTSFNDSGSCGLGESKGGDGNLGDLKESNVISHSANNDGDSVSIIEI